MNENTVNEATEGTNPESGVIEVAAKKGERSAAITYDFGKDLDEMVDKFGTEVVFTNARANMKISLQGIMRRRVEAGESCDDLTVTWKPGVQLERTVNPLEAARKALANMTEEERQEYINSLLSI